MIDILNLLNNVWPYIVAVLLFLILIIIHEFGHFVAAKAMGIKVNRFAVGFGPRLFSVKSKETEYSVNLLPFGGFCEMEGEDKDSTDSRAFCNKKAYKRAIVVVMGATFNLLLGFILVAVMLAPSKAFTSTTVAEFSENAVSEASGLKVNDTIISVDGRKIHSFYDLSYAFTNIPDGKIDMTVLRDGKKTELKDITFQTEEENGIDYLSIDFKVYGIKKTFLSYCGQTFKTGVSLCAVIWRSLIDMLAGKYGISAVSGPVGITVTIASIARTNLFNLIPIMALISINLGLFNLLPLPALDGGRLLFLIVEMIMGKPVPQKYEAAVHTVGFVILLALMILIAAKDILALLF